MGLGVAFKVTARVNITLYGTRYRYYLSRRFLFLCPSKKHLYSTIRRFRRHLCQKPKMNSHHFRRWIRFRKLFVHLPLPCLLQSGGDTSLGATSQVVSSAKRHSQLPTGKTDQDVHRRVQDWRVNRRKKRKNRRESFNIKPTEGRGHERQ